MSVTLKKEIIYKQIQEEIISGKYTASEKLPRATVLSEKMGVSMKTMRAALEQLEKDGYIQRIHGRGTFVNSDPIRNRPKYLLLVTMTKPESSNNVIVPLLERRAAMEGVELEKCAYEFFKQQPLEDSLKYIKEENFAGIINTATNYIGNEKILAVFKQCGLPTVQPHSGFSDRRITGSAAIHPSHNYAFSDGIRYLAEKGHRRIAILGYSSETGIRRISRPQFIDLLKKLDCETEEDFYAPCEYEEIAIHNAVRKLMDLPTQPTAILCSSDFYAIYVYRSMNILGLSIPDDVSVMGYCNFPGGQVMRPPLTTIDLGHQEAVNSAFELLKKSGEWFGKKDVAAPEIIVKHKIVERGSTVKRIECEMIHA